MRLMTAIGCVLISMNAYADPCRGDGSGAPLTVTDWSIEEVEIGVSKGMDITVSMRSNAQKPFRMVDASFNFEDALGNYISSFTADPDLAAAPGEVVMTVNGYLGSEMSRVLKMNRNDVVVYACTHELLYEDGTRETFE